MLTKSIAHELLICDNCQKFIIYKPASQGFPQVCPKCGVPSNHSLTNEERNKLQQQEEFIRNNNSQGVRFNFSRG